MPRLLVIGIDGMDPDVFEALEARLPNFSSLRQRGCFLPCPSVFPPDSIPAWVTIFTGEYPETHGWLDNIDYEDIRRGEAPDGALMLQGRTFWDRIGEAGKRVCVVNPLLAYPPWPVNGIMASGPVFITGEAKIQPAELVGKYSLPELGGMVDLPAEDELEVMLERSLRSIRELTAFGLELLERESWDLFFISYFTLDRVQHFLWRFFDPDDPLYPGPSALADAIPTAYEAFDEAVGRFLERIDPDDAVVVLSDHGHGRRPTMMLSVNEALRQSGLLTTVEDAAGRRLPVRKALEMTKNVTIRLVARVLGESWLYRIGRAIPKNARKALKNSSFLIDRERSLAWASNLGGGAPVGGVEIHARLDRGSSEYRDVLARVQQCLERVRDESGRAPVRWTRANGADSPYPDVVYALEPDFAVGRSLFCPVIERNTRHRVVSGGHKENGVFFAYNLGHVADEVHGVADIQSAIVSFVLR